MHPSRLGFVPDDGVSAASRGSPYRSSGPVSPARNGDQPATVPTGPKAPPTGPSASRNFSSPLPPAAPAANSPLSTPVRPPNPTYTNPARARGGYSSVNIGGGYRGGGWAGAAPAGPRRPADFSHAAGRGAFSSSHGRSPPAGPRVGAGAAPPFRGSANSTSTTYPRTQRFGPTAGLGPGAAPPPPHPSAAERLLADVGPPAPGGRRHAALPPATVAKIRRLEDEAERLRRAIDERKKVARAEVRDWEAFERHAARLRLAGELAEGNLRRVEEMGVGEEYVRENGRGEGEGEGEGAEE